MKKTILKLSLLTILFGWASSTWALSQDGNGVYQIGTAQDLIDFATGINNGSIGNNANAVLTADIDMTNKSWVPIGDNDHRYVGTFNGQFHMIDHLVYNGGEKAGIFGVVNGGCIIKNLIAGPNNVIKGSAFVGGIIGCEDGSGWVELENVGHEGKVEGSGNNCCAIIGVVFNGGPATRMTNCYNTGNVRAGGESAIITGWFGGHGSVEVKGFWNTGEVSSGVDNGQKLWRNSTGITYERIYSNFGSGQGEQAIDVNTLPSGAFAHFLNGNADAGLWRQNLEGGNTDAHPTLLASHGLVYANGQQHCDGTPKEGLTSYSNHAGVDTDAHQYVNGLCSYCDGVQTDYMTPVNNAYEIANAIQLNWFAAYVNSVDNTVDAKLTSDIDFSAYQRMIGNGDDGNVAYKGTFDGQGHKVTVAYENSTKHASLFMYLYSGSVVKNLITDGTVTKNGGQYGTGIFGGARGTAKVENCVSYVTITSSVDGDATIGGIGAYMFDTGSISNCAFLGTITAENAVGNGGILGYANGGSNIHITNCYVNASIDVKFQDNTSKIIGRGDPTISNCYYVGNMGNMENYMASNHSIAQAQEATTIQMSNGNLCYILNDNTNVWHQTIGTDAKPLPFGTGHGVVHNTGKIFTNNLANAEYFTIANANDLTTFANYVNVGYTEAKGKLTASVDFSGINNFPGIGNNDYLFAGEIDGQLNVISNLIMSDTREGLGLVNRATAGAIIKNLTIASSCSFTGSKAVGAFVGGTWQNSGTVTFLNCGNEGSVNSTGQNAGGILGCNFNGSIAIHMTNCYNSGTVTSGSEGGALSGWVSANKRIINCYNSGNLTNSAGFVRGDNNGDIINCWSTSNATAGNDCRDANTILTDDTQLRDGTVFTALHNYNANGVDGSVWKMEFASTRHPVLYAGPVGLAEDFPNIIETADGVDVTMYRTIKTGGWNTFCVPFGMSATQIASYFGNGTAVAQLKENASNDDVLHFETVSTITAGKAYLVYPGVSEDFTSKAIAGATIAATSPNAGTTQADFTFQGVFNPTQLTANKDRIVSGGNNSIVKTSGGTLKGFRAYFHPESTAARATSFVIDDGTATGIITAEGEVLEDGPVYNLNGQRVGQAARGIYIMNGKKVVMK